MLRLSIILTFLLISSQDLFAESQVIAVAHVHSNASKGSQSLTQIAKYAEQNQIDVVLMTDLLRERYEYGLWPFRHLIKKVVTRPSIAQFGFKRYFDNLRLADQKNPRVLMMGGVAATPYYYWTGSLAKKKLVLRERAKDMLAFGLNRSQEYETLPVSGTKYSRYSPYEGDHQTEAYQHFIDDVNQKGGVVFWSHPQSEEHESVRTSILDIKVRLETTNQIEQLEKTENYAGFGIDPVSLNFVHEQPSLITAGNVWDDLLTEYCRGDRNIPPWVIGESDYMGRIQADTKLNVILNGIFVDQERPEHVIDSLRSGKFYVLMPDQTLSRRLRLNEFSITDSGTGVKARMGEVITIKGLPRFRVEMSYPDMTARMITLQLIRNGKLHQEWQETVPFQSVFEDMMELPRQRSYYRLIAFTDEGDRILTNPIFVDPA